MKNGTLTAITIAFGVALLPVSAMAQDKMDHGKMDHQKMDHGQMMDHSKMGQGSGAQDAKPVATEANGVGVIHSIDTAKRQINLTHQPMPDLGWPEMTMDLGVTNAVDLATVKAGDKVNFRVKLGRDKSYRIMEMSPAK